ncbi:phosphotransferase [Streptomyces sp. NPDC052225]|uniref:phosphotransferase n=1 Tax=Streptomyces sp. NPDC052225 TaxID=3154949 RepID=UPI00342935E1
MTGEPLAGGLANAGAVTRHGSVVERPAPPHAPALHAHLNGLRRRGFDGAPTPVCLTADGVRERLTYIPGDVALPPFPHWSMTDDALRSVGTLLRRMHDAARAFPAGEEWSGEFADPSAADAENLVLCHNDVCPENVVFRAGRAAALIDFDMAAPGRPLWDVALTAGYWAPVLDPLSASLHYPPGLDPVHRVTVLADAYGLTPPDRAALPATIEQAVAVCRAFVERRLAAGNEAFVNVHAEKGGWARWDRRQEWLAGRRGEFEAALRR